MKSLLRVLALAVLLVPGIATAATPKAGVYELAYSATPLTETVTCLVKIDVKDDGSVSGTLVAAPPAPANAKNAESYDVEIRKVAMDGDLLRITIKNVSGEQFFEGTVAKPGEPIVGSFGPEGRVMRAKLIPTDKTEIARNQVGRRLTVPEAFTKANSIGTRPLMLNMQAQRETDAEKKQQLLKDAAEAQKAVVTEVPKLFREVVEKHADAPAAIDAALNLLRQAAVNRPVATGATPTADVARWAGLIAKAAEAHGPRYRKEMLATMAELLGGSKSHAPVGVEMAVTAEKLLDARDTVDTQSRVLEALAKAYRTAGKAAEADAADTRVDKLQVVLDTEYKSKMPPFKPTAFEGRKEKSDRVVVMELFTGAQCPPCVAADLAFDGLEKTYKPTDVVLLQYHVHIPGPDPMTNPNTEARFAYYRQFHKDKKDENGRPMFGGAPSSLFNGDPQAYGGGAVGSAEAKYKQYRDIIEKRLADSAGATLIATARREGNTIKMEAAVSDLKEPGEDKRLRFVLAEEEIRFVGSNKIRFHHMVVRDMPGGADGFKLTDKASKHTATVDLEALRANLVKYLDEFVEKRGPFPKPQRPLALKNLKVIALVQDDKTGEILQAAQVDLGGDRAAK